MMEPTPTPTPTATPTPTPTPTPTSPPYGLWFAWSALGVGLVAYAITLLFFGAKLDAAAVTGVLGALFTLIGTISGAYFGVKSSSDTNAKAAERVDEARNRESAALGALDSNKWANLRKDGLL